MPLIYSEESQKSLAESLQAEAKSTGTNAYLIIYASHVGGQSWCGDCRNAEPLVEKKFGRDDKGPTVTVVYAGDKPTWVL